MYKRIRHGDPDDTLWISATERFCATCGKQKHFREFHWDGVPDSSLMVTPDCKLCFKELKTMEQKQKELKTDDALASALARASGRRKLLDAAPRSADCLNSMIKDMGGFAKVSKRLARAVNRGLRHEDAEVGLKAANTMIGLVTTSEKLTGDPIDLSELTDEDRVMILMEPAKMLIMQNAEFRQQLLNDPEVRRILLGDAGIQVLEES